LDKRTKVTDQTDFIFQFGNLKAFFNLVLSGKIDTFRGEFDTQHCLFIFNDFLWKDIVFSFKKHFNVNISGGNTTKRHLLSHLVLRLTTYLLVFSKFNYNLLADSIVFDNVNKEKILPGFNFNKKNINFNIVDKKLSDRYEDIFGSESLTKKWIKIWRIGKYIYRVVSKSILP
jgi:hypothetical protein